MGMDWALFALGSSVGILFSLDWLLARAQLERAARKANRAARVTESEDHAEYHRMRKGKGKR